VLVLVPALAPDSAPAKASRLEVVILQPTPLPAATPDPGPAASASRKREPQSAPAAAEPTRRPELPAPVVALSGPRADERRSYSIDAAIRKSEPSATEQKARTAGAPLPLPGLSAAYLRNPAPPYPLAARRAGEQGAVTLRVLVTRDGLPERVDVEKSSGSAHLDKAALEAVKAWRFVPARQGAEPVESWMLVPVVFRLEGAS